MPKYDLTIDGHKYRISSDHELSDKELQEAGESVTKSAPKQTTTSPTAHHDVARASTQPNVLPQRQPTAPKSSTLEQQAREIRQANVRGNVEQGRQHQRELLAPYHAVADPVSHLLSMGIRGLNEAASHGIVAAQSALGMKSKTSISPLQQEINRQQRGMNPLQRSWEEDPRGTGMAVSPDTTRRVEAMPNTGASGFAKGLAGTAMDFATVDNATMIAAMGIPSVTKGGGAIILQRAAQGYFGYEGAKGARAGLKRWKESGFKNTEALADAMASASIAAMSFHEGVTKPALEMRKAHILADQILTHAESGKLSPGAADRLARRHKVDPVKLHAAIKSQIDKRNKVKATVPTSTPEQIDAANKALGADQPSKVNALPGMLKRTAERNKPAAKAPEPPVSPPRKPAHPSNANTKTNIPPAPKPTEKAPSKAELKARASQVRPTGGAPDTKPATKGSNVRIAQGKAFVPDGKGGEVSHVLPENAVERTKMIRRLQEHYDKPAEAPPVIKKGNTDAVQKQSPTSKVLRPKEGGESEGMGLRGVEPGNKPKETSAPKAQGKAEVAKPRFEASNVRVEQGKAYIKTGSGEMVVDLPANPKDRTKTIRILQDQYDKPMLSSQSDPGKAIVTEPIVQPSKPPKKPALAASPEPSATASPWTDFKKWVDKYVDRSPSRVRVYDKAADLYRSYKAQHPGTTREQFGQMLHDLASDPEFELVGHSGNVPESQVFTFKDSTGVDRRVIGVRPEDVTKGTTTPKPVTAQSAISTGVNLSPNEANTLGAHHDSGNVFGDMLSDAKKAVPLNKAQADAMRRIVEEKKLDKKKFPSLYPAEPKTKPSAKTAKDIQVSDKGPQELHSGIPLGRMIRTVLGDERMAAWDDSVGKLKEGLRGLVNPTGFGKGSKEEARAGRDYLGQQARSADTRQQALKPWAARFDRIPKGHALRFMFNMESGNVHADPGMQQAGDLLRDALDRKRDQVNDATGKLDAYIENYFPHEWKHPSKARSVFGEGRRPLEGSKSFLKKRTIPTMEEGMFPKGAPAKLENMTDKQISTEIDKQGGLHPLTYNPVEAAQLKLASMDKYLFAQKWFNEMKAQKRAVFLPALKQMPEGWAKVHDSIANVKQYEPTVKADGTPGAPRIIERGQWIVPEGAAMIINNHLSPGFSGHETAGPAYNAIAAVNNSLNMAQLGLSGFHATTTAFNSIIGQNALALDALLKGKPIKAATTALASPFAPIDDYFEGSKILKEYRNAGSMGGDIPAIVDSLTKGGGRVTLAKEFRLDAMERFGKAIRQRDIVGAGLSALPAAMEATMAPLMRDFVPKVKLGAFAELLRSEMEHATKGGKTLTEDQHREIAARAWDSIENRFGQLNYDNLFWDRAFQEAGHLSVRSLGWNIGTIRELGGAGLDIGNTRSKLSGGGSALTPRMAYAASLVFTTAMAGAIYGYLHGHKPETPEDYFHPKDSSGHRVSLPTYMKDAQNYGTDPLGTIYSKKSPMADLVIETLQNKDFFNKPLRNPTDPAVKQVEDYMRYLGKQVVPFSTRPKKGDSLTDTISRTVTTPQGREQAMGIIPYNPKAPARARARKTSSGFGPRPSLPRP